MLSIRMRRTGSKKRPFYRVVVTEARTPRDGSFIEVLGAYNPRTKPATVEIDRDRVMQWIKQGARPSDSVRTLLSRHLTRDRGAAPGPVTSAAVAPSAVPETPRSAEPAAPIPVAVPAPAAEPSPAPPAMPEASADATPAPSTEAASPPASDEPVPSPS